VFRTFFDKIVLPTVKNNDKVVSEWKYLNSLISEEHIDYSKLDFYLVLLAPERMANKQPAQMGSIYEKKDSEQQRFAKKDFFEEQRPGASDYKFVKTPPDNNFLHPEVNNYRNSGLSPNKFIDLNVSKEQGKDTIGRPQLDDANKRNLMLLLENFHTTLVNNQQKLENELKKDRKSNTNVNKKQQ
jgi:hypothetical protein